MALPDAAGLSNLLKNLIIKVNPSAAPWLTDTKVNLFEVGALDSVSIVALIQAFEESLTITFNYTDLRAYHFQTIDSIVSLLQSNYMT